MRTLVQACLGGIVFALGLLVHGAGLAEQPTYIFSVVPQYTPSQLHREWFPLIERIKRETGVNLELKISASIPKFETEFLKGAPDFAYMNPYHAVIARKAQGYLPLLRDNKPLTGMLLVRRDSPYRSVHDLNGKPIGFPAPNAFGASLYMRALLAENFKIRYEPHYLKTHSNVFRQIIRGDVAAGGTIEAAFLDDTPEIREQLRVLYQTPEVASHPVVVHPRVPDRTRLAVMEAFLALQNDDAGRNMLLEVRTPRPVKASYARDYSPLEALNVQQFVVLEKE